VATHKYRMFDKLGIKDTVALARMAAQHGRHRAEPGRLE
jgi:DNA-binding CsgD family transcriptional regulator